MLRDFESGNAFAIKLNFLEDQDKYLMILTDFDCL